MAVATTVARNAFNDGYYGQVNLRMVSSAGVSVGTVLTIAGDLVMTAVRQLPNNAWCCEVTGTPRGSARLIIRTGNTVSG
jgi:hypothetical protein